MSFFVYRLKKSIFYNIPKKSFIYLKSLSHKSIRKNNIIEKIYDDLAFLLLKKMTM